MASTTAYATLDGGAQAPEGSQEEVATSLVEPTSTTPTDAPGTVLDVAFGGSMASNTQYTTQGSEVMRGGLSVVDTAAVEGEGFNKFLRVRGNNGRMEFRPTALNLNDASSHGFVAEMFFTPTGNQGNLATVFSAGGNLFVRYQNSKLRYGFSSNASGSWTDHVKQIDVPAVNKLHLIQVAYTWNGTQATMKLSLDGVEQETITATTPATNAGNMGGVFAYGGEVNSGATGRGVTGTFSRLRLASPGTPYVLTMPSDPGGGGGDNDSCEFTPPEVGNYVPVESTFCRDQILAAASATRPNEKQVRFHEAGMTAFLHYGINTYYNQEWGHGTEDPARFNPSNLDTDQWVRTLAASGFRYAILTVKHHDGFMLYDSRYTTYDVGSSPWKGGKGDVVREFFDSARRYGLKVGIYLSPADSRAEIDQIYGNGSARSSRTIPTMVTGDDRADGTFDDGRPVPQFKYDATDYGAHFLNTLYELSTEYGEIDEFWFDGAGGNTTSTETFDYDAFYDLINKLQPGAAIAVAGRDVRWVGNEGGLAREAEWNVQAVYEANSIGRIRVKPDATTRNLGAADLLVSEVKAGNANRMHWWPAEADVSIRNGWFWHPTQSPKSVGQLMNIYRRSVGRNAILLLNMPPNTTGLIDDKDVKRLMEWRRAIRQSMPFDLAIGKPGTFNGTATAVLTDGDRYSAPTAPKPTAQAPLVYEVDLGKAQQITQLGYSEDIKNYGQQVENYKVEALVEGTWTQVAVGPTIGARRLDTLATPVTATKLRLTVSAARGPVGISAIEAYNADEQFEIPTDIYLDSNAAVAGTGLSKQSPLKSGEQLKPLTLQPGTTLHIKRGTVLPEAATLWGYGTATKPVTIKFYGSGPEPTAGGKTFTQIVAENSHRGFVLAGQAPSVTDGDDPALVEPTPAVYANTINPRDITVTASSEETTREQGQATKVLDGDPDTHWHSKWSSAPIGVPPNTLTFDLGKNYNVDALRYTGRAQGGTENSQIKDYEVYVSDVQGERGTLVASGVFAVGSEEQRVTFPPVLGRYVTLVAKTSQSTRNGSFSSAAEIRIEGVLPGSTPAPGGSATPAPGGSATPAPGGSATPAPGGSATPAPGGSATPAPGGSATPAPGGSATPAPGGSATPAPGGSATPAPSATATVPGAPLAPEVTRLAGTNRVKTALEAARAGDFGHTAVLVTGKSYPDGAAAAPLAAHHKAPILLTMGSKLEPEVRAALDELDIRDIVIVGGHRSVSAAVERELRGLDLTVQRIEGKDRFDTNMQVINYLDEKNVGKGGVFVTSGMNFADTLAASAVASKHDAVVLLTGTNALPAAAAQLLKGRAGVKPVGVGGDAVRSLLNAGYVPGTTMVDVAGVTRFDTAARLAELYMADATSAVVVSGATFADALPGNALAANKGGVVLLTQQSVLPESTRRALVKLPVSSIHVLGGTGTVSEAVARIL
ncbi:cell wall-binding repeat-containing protein [Buchananella felis]|uniref:cell wall-binding repeat-containing protein n=1 Tax=Buchananella felis TaxID=3231492 RepID=UPI003526C668